MDTDKDRKVKDTGRKKLAVVLFGERVSPYFGSSSKVLLVESEGDTIHEKRVRDLEGETPLELAKRLAALEIDLLVCGGIQRPLREWLESRGICVIENQKGQAEDLARDALNASRSKHNA